MARGTMAVLIGIAMTSSTFAGALDAQTSAGDPVLGVWVLNMERSVWSPGPRPANGLLRRYATLDGGWMRFTQTGIGPEGGPTFQISVFKLDGQRHPVHNVVTLGALMSTGRPSNLTRSFRVIDARTTESTTYTDGVAGIPVVRAVQADGRTMIETTRGTDAQGVAINNVLVWDRVQ